MKFAFETMNFFPDAKRKCNGNLLKQETEYVTCNTKQVTQKVEVKHVCDICDTKIITQTDKNIAFRILTNLTFPYI